MHDFFSKKNYPRHLAIKILTYVLREKKNLETAFEHYGKKEPTFFSSWIQEICSGTLRWKGRLDIVINAYSLKKKPSGWIRKQLLLAAYQLIVQDRTHAGAIVSETVEAIKKKEGLAPSRFANACLRKIAIDPLKWRNLPFSPQCSVPEQAQWASMPEWLWSKWTTQQGTNWAIKYAQASLDRPLLWIRSYDLHWNPKWAKSGPLPYSWQSLEGGSITQKEGFLEGQFFVQDISNQLLIHEVCLTIKNKVKSALDLCAAPGGKSMGLAWNGLDVTATDFRSERIPLLRETLSRTHASIKIIQWNELDFLPQKDLVWVDAPCSSSGMLRRHPETRWIRQEKELKKLQEIQTQILQKAWDKVMPGKFLVYSVCSLLHEEGPHQITSSGLKGYRIEKEWTLTPQEPPYGDGLWGILLQKLS